MKNLRAQNRRQLQLDAISSLLIVAMMCIIALLLYLFSSEGALLPSSVPLANDVPRILLGAFVLVVVAYIWEQRRLLTSQVNDAIEAAERAYSEVDATCRYLAFSHDAASKLGSQGIEDSMALVLQDASALFRADAAAVVGQATETVFIAPDVPEDEAEQALAHVAVVATGKGTPLLIESLGTEQGQAIAVPLRAQGELRCVLALWKRTGEFDTDQLNALGLMGRMVELAIEREESLKDAQDQLEGTLQVLQYLVADKRPDYSRHALDVAELASEIGFTMGLPTQTRKDLRLAGLIHDVGMMSAGDTMDDAGNVLSDEGRLVARQHPRVGSEIAKAANFDSMVQEAVAGHHERMDGSGYPLGLHGEQIPMSARIIAICEVYDSMSNRSYGTGDDAKPDAMMELIVGAGSLYDESAVSALGQVLEEFETKRHAHSAVA